MDWCSSIKYLGVNLLGGRSLKFDTMPTKRAFYSACNSIFMCGTAAGELVLLTLQESYSLPVDCHKFELWRVSVNVCDSCSFIKIKTSR